MEIATIVLIVLNVLFGLFIFLGFMWGLKRGVKKSALRIAFIAGALVLAFAIAIPVTNALMTMDISSIVNQTDENGQQITNIEEMLVNAMTQNAEIKELYDNSESFRALIDALPKMLVQCVVFVILFWVLKILTWIIYAIVAKAIWGKKKKSKQEKEQEKQENRTVENGKVIENGTVRPVEEKPIKKHRLAGALVGTLQGFMIAFFTMIPLAGIASIMSEVDKSSTKTVSASTESSNNFLSDLKPLGDMVRESVGDDVVNALLAYDKSALGVICGWTGIDDLAFDLQSSAKIGDTSTTLRHEVIALVNAYDQVRKLESTDLSTLNFDTVQKVFDYLFDSRALTNIADDLLPYYVDKLINDPNQNLDSNLKKLLTMYVDNYNTPSIYDIKNDLSSIITAMKVIQENDIFAVIEDENFSVDTLISILEENEQTNPIKDIFVALTDSTTIQKFLQVSVNFALDTLSEQLTKINDGKTITIEHATFNNIDWNNVKNEVPQILNNFFDLYKQIKDDTKVDAIVNNVDFVLIGKTLDILTSSTLLEQAYNNTITALNTIEAYTKYIDISALNSNINFEQEFTYIQNSVNALKSVDALNILSGENVDIKEFISKLGQKVNQTSNETCIDVIAENLTQSTILKASAPRSLNVLYQEQLQPKVEYVIDKITATQFNWQNEKTALSKTLNFIASNAEYFLGESIVIKDIVKNVNLTQLGESLDAMKQSGLLYPLYKVGVDYIKNNKDIAEYLDVESITYDTNWTQELTHLQNALDVAIEENIIDSVFDSNGIESVLNAFKNDNTIIERIVDNLFNSTILQNSVEKLINQLQNLIATQLNITIEPTTVDIDDFINNLSTKKQEFSNIINNIAVVASPIMQESFNLDTFANNIDSFAQAFNSLQSSTEFKNTYNGIITYLSNNESINEVIDFSVVGENFDYITEFNKLEEIINMLKANDVWTPLVDGTKTVDEVLDTLDNDTKSQLTELILESKLFSGLAVDTLNQMIDEFNNYLGTTIAHIPQGTDLSSQSENIAEVTKFLLEISNDEQTQIDIKTVNLNSLGNLLNCLKSNKFDFTNGALTDVYNEFVNYVVNDADYGYIIVDACNYFDTENIYTNANENRFVDWYQICTAFDSLLQVESDLNNISTLTATDVVNVINTIGTNSNNLVPRIAKTFLKNGKTVDEQAKIDAFDLADTEFNTTAINILYELKDLEKVIDNKSQALDNLGITLTKLQSLDQVKLNNLVGFIDVVTNTTYSDSFVNLDYDKEITAITDFKNLLNYDGELTLEFLTQSVTAFNNSTLVLNELAKNNIVICDLQSQTILDQLKKSISGGENFTNEQVQDAVKTIINDNVDADKQANILSILNLNN